MRQLVIAAALSLGVAAPALAVESGSRNAPLPTVTEQLAPAGEYAAYRRHGRRAYRGWRNAAGAAVAAGIAGAVIGGVIASQNRDRYYDRGYGYYDRPHGYYGHSYGYGPSYYEEY